MMDIKTYIDKGNLEQYCFELFNSEFANEVEALGSVHPEIRQELKAIELTIEQLALSQAILPPPQLRNRILAALDLSEEMIDLNNLPPTSKYSSYQAWFKAVEHLVPVEPLGDFFMALLRQDEKIAQMLVVTKLDVPEESHDIIAESFFILKGSCTCTVGNKVFTLNAGDHLDIPLHTNHDIKIQSPYVVAILQHQF